MIPTRVIIHCSASKNGVKVPIETIRTWHLSRGWKDIGYHLVIQPSGEVERGRGLNEQGAGVEGANEGSIHICLVGLDKFTYDQFHALEGQLDGLFMCFESLQSWAIYTHAQFPSAIKQGKTCPNIPVNPLLYWYWQKDPKAIKDYLC